VRITGIRAWNGRTSSFAVVVMMQHVSSGGFGLHELLKIPRRRSASARAGLNP
jgi:hypothetical protein